MTYAVAQCKQFVLAGDIIKYKNNIGVAITASKKNGFLIVDIIKPKRCILDAKCF